MTASEQFSRDRLIRVVVLVASLLLCVGYLAANPSLVGGPMSSGSDTHESLTSGWTTEDGTPVSLNSLTSIPGFEERGCRIHRRLPNACGPMTSLNFLSKNLTVHLYYDDEEVYAHDPDVATAGQPYGVHFNFAPLGEQSAGKLATLELHRVYEDTKPQIVDMNACDTAVYIQDYVLKHGPAFVVSLLIVFIGLVVIVMHVALLRVDHGELDLLALGSTSILLGLWSAAETLVPQLTTGLGPLITALDYMALLFAPYPMVRFAGSLMHPRNRKRFDLVALVVAVAAIGSTMVLAVVGGHDMHVLLRISHLQLVFAAATVIVEGIISVRERRAAGKHGISREHRGIIISFLFFLGCAILDFVVYNATSSGSTDSAFFMRLGLFVFTLVLSAEAFNASMLYIKRAEQASVIEKMAYTDTLTGIGNRTAWQQMNHELDEALQANTIEDVAICQFDVNFLKRVNDTFGHAAGDEYLRRAASTINRAFGTEGTCFRTGGDEFTAVIVGVRVDERYDRCLGLLEESMREQQATGEGGMPVSVAVGHGKLSEVPERTLEAAQGLADERMYENKREMKACRED